MAKRPLTPLRWIFLLFDVVVIVALVVYLMEHHAPTGSGSGGIGHVSAPGVGHTGAGPGPGTPVDKAPGPGPRPGSTATSTAAPAQSPGHAAPAVTVPALAPTVQELHGTFQGQPFWARLLPVDPGHQGDRKLMLVYTPPAKADVGGSVLIDCPFIWLDPQLRVDAWDGRDGICAVTYLNQHGYKVDREILKGTGEDAVPGELLRSFSGGKAWDLRLAPVFLALAWHQGTVGSVPVDDFFGPLYQRWLLASWKGVDVEIGGDRYHVVADQAGRLGKLVDMQGKTVLSVEGRP